MCKGFRLQAGEDVGSGRPDLKGFLTVRTGNWVLVPGARGDTRSYRRDYREACAREMRGFLRKKLLVFHPLPRGPRENSICFSTFG